MTADTDTVDEVIVGVDTHEDVHVAVAINDRGQLLDSRSITTNAEGYAELVEWAARLGRFERAGVEGTGAYGAGLARHLSAAGIKVIEVDRPNRQRRRRRGKSDHIDAETAARAVLAGDATTTAKDSSGVVEAIRILHLTRRSAVKARTQAGNQIKDVIRTSPDELRSELRGLSTVQRVKHCAATRPGPVTDPASAARRSLHDLACRWLTLNDEIKGLDANLRHLLEPLVPSLLAEHGVGPEVAAKLVIACGEQPDRLRNEAAFAALCGTSPVEASSGKHQRHRLNRGGNRHANNALHTVVLHRSRRCEETRVYIERRRAEGKTDREIWRCLKRALARRFHHHLVNDLTTVLT
jgi:transposase